jgi:uroporphyrinogen-III synthase
LPRVEKLVAELQNLGFEAFPLGLQKIVIDDDLRNQTTLAWQRIAQFDALVFVSPNAVDVFFDARQEHALTPNLRVLCVGPATAQALAQRLPSGSQQLIGCGTSNDADGVVLLLNNLRQESIVKTKSQGALFQPLKVLVVRGVSGRDDWIAACRTAGDLVEVLAAYRSIEQAPSTAALEQLFKEQAKHRQGDPSSVVFVVASTQLTGRLFDCLSAASPSLAQWALGQPSLAIHQKIVQRLQSFGFVAPKLISPGVQGIVEGLK